ncbi:hypothetical protein BDN72DRAFT_222800 [Pluteus cervinus]|uniref:Uncharacterized protein n=1 Tax=Pluteus cervinus TaxID=181527 RepID=A0ACD3AGT7_9AGAR|nr:hypothetical protein BDN72DRAFT_222800 [Pluteus cervinus]
MIPPAGIRTQIPHRTGKLECAHISGVCVINPLYDERFRFGLTVYSIVLPNLWYDLVLASTLSNKSGRLEHWVPDLREIDIVFAFLQRAAEYLSHRYLQFPALELRNLKAFRWLGALLILQSLRARTSLLLCMESCFTVVCPVLRLMSRKNNENENGNIWQLTLWFQKRVMEVPH